MIACLGMHKETTKHKGLLSTGEQRADGMHPLGWQRMSNQELELQSSPGCAQDHSVILLLHHCLHRWPPANTATARGSGAMERIRNREHKRNSRGLHVAGLQCPTLCVCVCACVLCALLCTKRAGGSTGKFHRAPMERQRN